MHISAIAAGYRDGELFLPSIPESRDLEDIVIKLDRLDSEAAAKVFAKVRGKVARDGHAAADGWASIWYAQHEADTLNVELMRGCPVPRPAWPAYAVELATDGVFAFEQVQPSRLAFLVVAVPGRALHIQKLELRPGGQRELDVAMRAGGAIRGRVTGVPEAMHGRLFVVAFDQFLVRMETRIAADDSFSLTDLPPGTYGLRVGHDAFELLRNAWPEVFTGHSNDDAARPWLGIERLRVASEETLDDVTVPFVQGSSHK